MKLSMNLPQSFFARPAPIVARELLSKTLIAENTGGVIVETEAYTRDDPASHSHRGPTSRNAAMFGPAGHAYVYRSYGIHWCFNIVCETGAAVLVRAVKPTMGIDIMIERRGLTDLRKLCAGPGRLCQALGITGAHDGIPIDGSFLAVLPGTAGAEIVPSSRVGISKATERPWRFCLADSPFLSKPA